MIEEITKNQPDSIVHAIKASFMFFDRFGMPPIDPESVFVVSATNRGGGCIVLETLHVDEMTAVFEAPGSDAKHVPELAQARTELLEKRAEGATEGVILWVQDYENNYFIVPIGRVAAQEVNASGGDA